MGKSGVLNGTNTRPLNGTNTRPWVILLVVIWAALGLPAVGAETQEGRISLHRSPVNGDRFSMEFRDADVKDVLRAIGQERRLNLVVRDDISGKLTLSFQQVTLAEAFEAILKMENLVKVQEGAITRVIPSPFTDGEGQLVTKMVAIQFATAKELSEPIKGLLSKKGSLSADARTNTLIVRDVPESVERIAEIIKQLDSKTPQVMIEAPDRRGQYQLQPRTRGSVGWTQYATDQRRSIDFIRRRGDTADINLRHSTAVGSHRNQREGLCRQPSRRRGRWKRRGVRPLLRHAVGQPGVGPPTLGARGSRAGQDSVEPADPDPQQQGGEDFHRDRDFRAEHHDRDRGQQRRCSR